MHFNLKFVKTYHIEIVFMIDIYVLLCKTIYSYKLTVTTPLYKNTKRDYKT